MTAGTNDGFLAIDHDQNRRIDDGNELFGDSTLLILEDTFAPSGFAAMAQYDHPALGGNGDGYLSYLDQIWPELLIWTDRNANGRTEEGELKHATACLNFIDLVPEESGYIDPHGNHWRFFSHAEGTDHTSLDVLDVFFDRHLDRENDHVLINLE